ncbi:hypothetical protein Taro_043141, partial [Colocasia esculenta]|nr:hypothetical protein [Colocasia esculenta]
FPSVVKEDLVGSQGVVFPSVVKEDLELGVGWVADAAVAPCVVSSSESECCELLYPNPWVAMRTSGPLAVVREVGSLQLVSERESIEICKEVHGFPARFVCMLQWVAVVAESLAWRVRSLGVFVSWWHSWRWTRWQWSFPCSVCRVASLVERYDTCLWLLSAWCWLVVSSSEVLSESFSVGSGGSEGLRCAVGLAGMFWRIFPERCFGGSGGGSSQDRPLSFLVEVLLRSALCSFRATVVLPLWFEVCRLVGLHSGDVLPGRLLALLVEAFPVKVWCPWLCVWLLRWPGCLIVCFRVSRLRLWDFVCPHGRVVCLTSRALRALPDGGL